VTTHHCHRSNWTGPESELRRGICPKCAETTLYEDCSVRPMAITFTDGEGRFHVLRVDDESNATPDDLARAGYVPAFDKEKLLLQRLETHVRNPPRNDSERARWDSDLLDLLKAIDEARK
jgi:hypothetical protein